MMDKINHSNSLPQTVQPKGVSPVYKKPFSSSIQAFVDYLKIDPAREIMRQMGNIPDWRNASSSHREAHLKSPSK